MDDKCVIQKQTEARLCPALALRVKARVEVKAADLACDMKRFTNLDLVLLRCQISLLRVIIILAILRAAMTTRRKFCLDLRVAQSIACWIVAPTDLNFSSSRRSTSSLFFLDN